MQVQHADREAGRPLQPVNDPPEVSTDPGAESAIYTLSGLLYDRTVRSWCAGPTC